MKVNTTHIEAKKQLSPALRFEGFEINWSKVDLKSVVKVNQGLAILRSNRFETAGPNRYNYITIPYLLGGKSHFIENPQESVKCKEDDVIVTRTGSGVGQIWTGVSGVFHNNFFKVLPIEGKVRKDFIYHYLLSPFVQKKMKSYAGSSAIPDLNHSEFYLLPFNLPSLPEQKKIASFLSAVDKKIQQLRKKKELLEQYKKGVMQQLFSGELRFKEERGKAYPDWEEVVMEDIFSRVKEKNKENNLNVLTISAQMGLINQRDYFNRSVSAKDVTGYYLIKNGDFAYNKSYSKGYPMGAIKRLDFYDKGVVSTLYICFRISEKDDSTFYKELLDYGGINKELHKIAQEGARNHGLLNMSVVEFFRDIKIIRPSIQEQKIIGKFLEDLSSKIEFINKELIQTQTFKKGLLQQMFV